MITLFLRQAKQFLIEFTENLFDSPAFVIFLTILCGFDCCVDDFHYKLCVFSFFIDLNQLISIIIILNFQVVYDFDVVDKNKIVCLVLYSIQVYDSFPHSGSLSCCSGLGIVIGQVD